MADELMQLKHNITLNNREQLQAGGITDVLSFDEENIVAKTNGAVLIIRGCNLHISSLNLEKGNLSVTGTVNAVMYDDELEKRQSLLSRIFR